MKRQALLMQVSQDLFFAQHGALRSNEHITIGVNRLQGGVVLLPQRSGETFGVDLKNIFRRHKVSPKMATQMPSIYDFAARAELQSAHPGLTRFG
jgi:hypothetical protein